MSDEERNIDNISENSAKNAPKRVNSANEPIESLPKRPRMNLWEHSKSSNSTAKDDSANVDTDDSVSNISSGESEVECETSLEELAASICGLSGSEYSSEELESFNWLSTMPESFKSIYLYVRNKACMLWLKDPKSQLIDKVLINAINNTSNDKYFQDIIALKLCNYTTLEDNSSKNQNRLNTIDRVTLKKNDIDSIIKDSLYKDNISKIAVMVIAFLERYGYINFGNFAKSTDSYTNASYSGNNGTPLQVVIIGAGLAGIIAALQLQYFGCKVLVLEAQENAGGRLKTFHKNGLYADVSPFTINGINNPVNQLIKQAGLAVSIFNSDIDIVNSEGDNVSKDNLCRIECEVNRLLLAASDICNKFCFPSINSSLNDSNKLNSSGSYNVFGTSGSKRHQKELRDQHQQQKQLCSITMGEMLTGLLTLQMSHCRNLKKNSNTLILKLMNRLQEVVVELEKHKADTSKAYEKWSASEDEARKRSNVKKQDSENDCVVDEIETSNQQKQTETNKTNLSTMVNLDPVTAGDTSNDEEENSIHDNKTPQHQQKASDKSSKLTIFNPEMQMKVNLALSEYRRVFQRCSPYFDEAVKIRKMIKLIQEYDPATMLMDKQDMQLMDLFLSNLEMRVGTDLKNLSILFVNHHQCSVDLAAGEIFIKKGYQALINSLVKKSNIYQFNTTVKDINYTGDAIKLTAINTVLSEDEPVHYMGNVVISALPLGVLQESVNNPEGYNSPAFIPSLPDWKIKSIKNLGFGHLDKVVLCFKERFWGSSKNKVFAQLKSNSERRNEFPQFYAISIGGGNSGSGNGGNSGIGSGSGTGNNNNGSANVGNYFQGDVSDVESNNSSTPDNLTVDDANSAVYNASRRGNNEAMVVGMLYGTAALLATEESDENLGRRALESLKSIFRRKKITVPEPTSIHVFRWSSDVHIRGSLTFLSDKSNLNDITNVAAPLPVSSMSNQSGLSTYGSVTNTSTTSGAGGGARTRRATAAASAATNNSNGSGASLESFGDHQGDGSGISQTFSNNCFNNSGNSSSSICGSNSTVPRLFFAGEHTHLGCGSIQSAMLSGLNVANQVCRYHFPQWPNVVLRMPGNLQYRK